MHGKFKIVANSKTKIQKKNNFQKSKKEEYYNNLKKIKVTERYKPENVLLRQIGDSEDVSVHCIVDIVWMTLVTSQIFFLYSFDSCICSLHYIF